jgi:hypothetical protein
VGAGHLEIDELEPEIDAEPESESPDELLHPEPTDEPGGGAVHEKGA